MDRSCGIKKEKKVVTKQKIIYVDLKWNIWSTRKIVYLKKKREMF